LFYGVVTLLQLVDRAGPAAIPAATISDRPDLALRGITVDFRYAWMSADHIRRTIDRAAALKANFIAWWLEEQFAWKSHPELAGPRALSADEWRGLAAYGRDRFVAMVPYVDAYGHGETYLDRKEWKEVSRGEKGYWGGDDIQYCASHPKTWTLFDDLSREAVAAFGEVPYFHIGMDEVGAQDDHLCAECREKVRKIATETGEAEPFPQARNRFVARRLVEAAKRVKALNRRTILWDDSATGVRTLALGPGGIEIAPTEVIPMVWNYDSDVSVARAALGRPGAGKFETIVGSSSSDPENIANLVKLTREFPNVIGAIATIWEGDIYSIDRRWNGFALALALGWRREADGLRLRESIARELSGKAGDMGGASGWVPQNRDAGAPMAGEGGTVRYPGSFGAPEDWRAFWDRAVRLDLSKADRIRYRIRCADPDAVKAVAVYYRSGEGWYKCPEVKPGKEWATVDVSRNDAVAEGKPAGWGVVDGMRFAVLPEGRRDAVVEADWSAEKP
jgi:hypothetical protein